MSLHGLELTGRSGLGPGTGSALREPVKKIAGHSLIEWASAFMPVLAVSEGYDLQRNLSASICGQVFTCKDLAKRLHLDPERAFGVQLAERSLISNAQARLIDGEYFWQTLLKLRLQIDNSDEDAVEFLADLAYAGLVDDIAFVQKCGKHLFVEIKTHSLIELAQIANAKMPGKLVLLSVNDSLLYL